MKNFTQRHGGTKDTEEGKVRGIHGLTRKGKGWEVMKLGEVCDFYNGLWTGKKPPFQTVGVIRNTNFTKDCLLDDTDIVYLEVEQSQFKNRKLQFGDIILEKSGGGPKQPVGRVVVYDKKEGDFSFSNFTSVIRIKNSKQLDFVFLHKFLFHEYLSGATEKMQSHSTGIRNLKFDEYKEIPIPLPSLSEQKHIVAILNECFTAIDKVKANVEKNLINARELFESYLQGVFENGNNWETKRLNDVALVFGRGKSKHRPRNWEGLYNGDYPFIQTGDVRNASKYVTEFSQTYNEVGLAQSKLWKKGTICITIAANIAETAILGFDACIPDSIIGFEVDPQKTDLEFTYYLLQQFKTELQKLGKGSAQDNINLGTFENQFFPFPPLKVQKNIVRQLDGLRAETQKLEAVYNKKIADLEELKKSILQKAFAGELL